MHMGIAQQDSALVDPYLRTAAARSLNNLHVDGVERPGAKGMEHTACSGFMKKGDRMVEVLVVADAVVMDVHEQLG